eukprot:scaffold622274_cov18-Prasinocladus_malaysianus.AAC.1
MTSHYEYDELKRSIKTTVIHTGEFRFGATPPMQSAAMLVLLEVAIRTSTRTCTCSRSSAQSTDYAYVNTVSTLEQPSQVLVLVAITA